MSILRAHSCRIFFPMLRHHNIFQKFRGFFTRPWFVYLLTHCPRRQGNTKVLPQANLRDVDVGFIQIKFISMHFRITCIITVTLSYVSYVVIVFLIKNKFQHVLFNVKHIRSREFLLW